MLSCDHIEPAKFIQSSLSLAKLVYYSTYSDISNEYIVTVRNKFDIL